MCKTKGRLEADPLGVPAARGVWGKGDPGWRDLQLDGSGVSMFDPSSSGELGLFVSDTRGSTVLMKQSLYLFEDKVCS